MSYNLTKEQERSDRILMDIDKRLNNILTRKKYQSHLRKRGPQQENESASRAQKQQARANYQQPMKCIHERGPIKEESPVGGKRYDQKDEPKASTHVCNKRLDQIRHNSISAPYTKRKRLLESWIKKDETSNFVEKMGTINSEVNKFQPTFLTLVEMQAYIEEITGVLVPEEGGGNDYPFKSTIESKIEQESDEDDDEFVDMEESLEATPVKGNYKASTHCHQITEESPVDYIKRHIRTQNLVVEQMSCEKWSDAKEVRVHGQAKSNISEHAQEQPRQQEIMQRLKNARQIAEFANKFVKQDNQKIRDSLSEQQNLDLSGEIVPASRNSKFRTIDPQPIANIQTNGNGVGNFKEPKLKVQALLSTIDNMQNNSSIDYMASIDDQSSDCGLEEGLFDDYLRMEKSRHNQEYRNTKVRHRANTIKLSQHFNHGKNAKLFKKRMMTKDTSGEYMRDSSLVSLEIACDDCYQKDNSYAGPNDLAEATEDAVFWDYENQREVKHASRGKSKNATLSRFGKFQGLPMSEQRLLLLGASSAAPGSQGKYLSKRELIDLQECLKVDTMEIRTEKEIADEYTQMYDRAYIRPTSGDERISSCQKFTYNREKQRYDIDHLRDKLRAIATQKMNNAEYQELQQKIYLKQMKEVIQFLKLRNTRSSMIKAQQYYEHILQQLTGKQQQMNMFKINKQMEEIKKVIESHENKTKDIPDVKLGDKPKEKTTDTKKSVQIHASAQKPREKFKVKTKEELEQDSHHAKKCKESAHRDVESQKFKMLTNFLNSYKAKLLIGNMDQKEGAGENKEKKETNMPLTLEQLRKYQKDGAQDITLDYDIYLKIKQTEEGKGKKKQQIKDIMHDEPSTLRPKTVKNQSVQGNAGKDYRERLENYASKKRKFNQENKKFIFSLPERDKTLEELKDMRLKGKPVMSSYCQNIQIQQQQFAQDQKRIQSQMKSGQVSLIQGVQDRRRKQQEDIQIKQEISKLKELQVHGLTSADVMLDQATQDMCPQDHIRAQVHETKQAVLTRNKTSINPDSVCKRGPKAPKFERIGGINLQFQRTTNNQNLVGFRKYLDQQHSLKNSITQQSMGQDMKELSRPKSQAQQSEMSILRSKSNFGKGQGHNTSYQNNSKSTFDQTMKSKQGHSRATTTLPQTIRVRKITNLNKMDFADQAATNLAALYGETVYHTSDYIQKKLHFKKEEREA